MNMTTNSDSTLETSANSFFEPQKILGWHFSEDTKLGFRDNRPIVVGETLSVKGEIIPCEFGLHVSEKALDAFNYVKGNYLWRVELEGNLRSHGSPTDKWVGRYRKVLAGGDATEMLQKFGRDCALEVFHLLPDAPPEEVKTFLETGVITEVVDNYFDYYNNAYVASYVAFYAVFYACKAFYAYYDYKPYYTYRAIYNAAQAKDVSFETYIDKFEQACLEFINEKS